MNNYKKGNKVTHSSVFDMIPEEYRFEGYQRWMDYARYDWLENPKCEEWDNLIEEEVNGWVPLTFMLCVSVPIQIVQQRAGHQDPKITLAVYSHVSKDKESLVADTLGEILFVWHENLQADK